MRRGSRKFLRGFVLLLLGAALAVWYADPILDLLQRGRRAAFGPPPREGPALAPPVPVTLFFASEAEDLLARYPAEVDKGKDTVATLRGVLEALLAGPQREGYAPVLPPGTKLRAVVPGGEGVVYVDFERAFRDAHPGGAWSEMLTAYAVADTVIENFREEFDRVVILIEGQEAQTVAGAFPVAGPLRFRGDLVSKAVPARPAAPEGPPAPPAAAAPPPPPPPVEPPPAVGVPTAPLPPVGVPPAGAPAEGGEVPAAGAPAEGR